VLPNPEKDRHATFDPDQGAEPISLSKYYYRRAEARLVKYGSETSTGADLLTR
jgi:hypothetical protein